MINPLDLTGRRILVTGASSGIGQATAVLLSQLGAQLLLVGRNEGRLQETLTLLEADSHQVFLFDLNATEEIPRWLKGITTESGPLNGLVHCAGTLTIRPLRFTSVELVEEMMRVNYGAAYGLCKGFMQRGCHAQGGSIVLLSSVAAYLARPAMTAYSASKGAVTALARALAVEVAREGVRVNCVAPGAVSGGMLDSAEATLLPEQIVTLAERHPLGMGTPQDVAHAIAFLLADTGRWITGTTLMVDGGYTAQ